jgi:hypothetical protein
MLTCATCGHELTAKPTMIAGLPFGPECAKKAAKLEAILSTHGLELPVTLEMLATVDGYFRLPFIVSELTAKAARAGLSLEIANTWGETPTVTISLKPGKALKTILGSPRAKFVTRLSLGVI